MSHSPAKLSSVRRLEIVEAFGRCVRDHGLAGSSMRRVAAEAGVTQPLLMHHFGSRAGLVEALIEHSARAHKEAIAAHLDGAIEDGDSAALVDFLFGGAFSRIAERDDVLFPELIATGVRDPDVARIVRSVFEGFRNDLAGRLAEAHPKALPAECRRVALGLVCLCESNEQLRSVAFRGRRREDMVELARALVGTLDASASRAVRR